MEPLLENVKVLEVTMWGFGPAGAAVLADWGAEVIKIEPPNGGDPMRGLMSTLGVETKDGYNYYFQNFNRSKRSVGLDLASPDGHAVFMKMAAEADVVLTSFLEPARERLKITYDDVRAVNPRIIYARGHGQGQRGPQAYDAGFDGTAYWARAGVAHMCSPIGGDYVQMPAGAFGDVQGGFALASGIAAALYRREKTGKGGLIDVSLLGMGVWTMAATLLAAEVNQEDPRDARNKPEVRFPKNPLTGNYATADGRWLALVMLESDRYWAGFCRAMGHDALIDDPRFNSFDARATNREPLYELITETLRSRKLEEWLPRLREHSCVFSVVQSPLEVLVDPQVQANGYFIANPGSPYHLAASPVQYNNGLVEARSTAPEAGQHTEEVLLELGYDWDQIIALKEKGAIN